MIQSDLCSWDYLIITASNQAQASAYENQVKARQKLGKISAFKHILVVPDPQDQRVGSGGSTLHSIMQVLEKENAKSWEDTLKDLRILIIHAGGDSKRLPAYGPCGKIFLPIPGDMETALGEALFDRQVPIYQELPPSDKGSGQIVITTGDVLLFFDPSEVSFQKEGITALGSYVSPERAKNHGVFCLDENGEVRRFLQKPPVSIQQHTGALNGRGLALLDIGVMSIDPATAVQMLQLVKATSYTDGKIAWQGPLAQEIQNHGLDFFREICCAMGSETDFSEYIKSVRTCGSLMNEAALKSIFDAMASVPFHVLPLHDCEFLHFGTMSQLINSGNELIRRDHDTSPEDGIIDVNNDFSDTGQISGQNGWVEGCRISAAVTLEGENAVVGVDIQQSLSLPVKTCLDIIKIASAHAEEKWIIRIFGLHDDFKKPISQGTTLCNLPFTEWLQMMGMSFPDIWDSTLPEQDQNIWNARIFPAASHPHDYISWLWLLQPDQATPRNKQSLRSAQRYSLADIATLADQQEFLIRRRQICTQKIQKSQLHAFKPGSQFAKEDLVFALQHLEPSARWDWIVSLIQAMEQIKAEQDQGDGLERLNYSRILFTLGSALTQAEAEGLITWEERPEALISLSSDWSQQAQNAAFDNLSRTIVLSHSILPEFPRCALRPDEIIWGRAPARFDIGGGWTDTPPYALEHGGCVINAAINLNGQPPIHVYARLIDTLEIRIASIDHGKRLCINSLEELMDYHQATSEFGLAKAALVLSGLALEKANWPNDIHSLKDMLKAFGGGIELTTLAAIPSGSGLGTSSIMGAVLIKVINRMIGREMTNQELFFSVLQLEQELTTGGGWQDQIGGTIPGVKMITTEPGLKPDPLIQPVPADILDPKTNSGQTILYYTGMRRLAKNILRNIVGKYLSRDRICLDTLQNLYAYPPQAAAAMSSQDLEGFGELIHRAWLLNKQIDPDSSNAAIEKILQQFEPFMFGAKLLGAGAGGFLLVVCKSPEAAQKAKSCLEENPPNALARFFNYDINTIGLEVTVC